MQTNVEEIYNRHIKSLPIAEQLKLIEKMAQELSLESDQQPQKKRSLLELEGLGAEIWQGIDAQEYVNELRSEWDHRP